MQGQYPDLSDQFRTSQLFINRDELLKHVRSIAALQNITLVIQDSRKTSGNIQGYAKIICHFGGKYRPGKSKNQRLTSSKRIGCKFELRAKDMGAGLWGYVVKHGSHNHDFPTYPEGHPLGKLSQDEYEEVCTASQSSMRPNNILTMLKKKDKKNVSTQTHVHNAIVKFKAQEREGRSPLQQFMKLLDDNQYIVFTRKAKDSDIIGDVFFSHPLASHMLNCFPYVVQGKFL